MLDRGGFPDETHRVALAAAAFRAGEDVEEGHAEELAARSLSIARRYPSAMALAENRVSADRRQALRSIVETVPTAATISSSESQRNPVTPCSMTSGVEAQRRAMTGVPQARDSGRTRAQGSGHRIGKRRAVARREDPVSPRHPPAPATRPRGPGWVGSSVRRIPGHRFIGNVSSEPELHPGAAGDADRGVGALVRGDSSQKREVGLPARFR